MITLPKNRQAWAELFLALTRLGLGFYLLLTPFGISFREIGGATATVSIGLYYALDWKGSVLRSHPLRWIFAALFAVVVLKTVHTIHFPLSWYAFRHGLHATFFLGVAGLESVREWRHLRALLWCGALMIFAEGLTGVWQGVTGRWFGGQPQFYILGGRLVGTMETPRVGNLISLLLPVTFVVPFMGSWPRGKWWKALLAILLFVPGCYLLVFSKTRSGWMGFAVSMFLMILLRFGWRFAVTLFVAGVAAAFVLSPERLSMDILTADQRWRIWQGAIDVFRAYPLFGSGINTYGDALKGLGYTFNFAFMPHPHNIYLQALSETGIVGFLVFGLFWGGSLYCMLSPLVRRKDRRLDPRYLMSLVMSSAWAGYLATAVSAHNIYRTWWLGLALAVQGLALASARLLENDMPEPP